MATTPIKDAAGVTVAIENPLAPGRAAAAASKPVALSTEDKAVLDTLSTKLGSAAAARGSGAVDANTTRVTLATDGPGVAALSSIDTKTPALVSGRSPVDGSGVTQPVSAASLPLPTGASTSALQGTTNTTLSAIDTKLGAALPLPTGAATAAKQPAIGVAGTSSADVLTVQGRAGMTALLVDASATTQPVSAASLPLPTGASTSALQGTTNTTLSAIDTKLGVALPLPTGAATSALQTTGNSSLSSIDGKLSGPLALAGVGYRSAATITRPANATPYTAGDVVGGVITFASIGPTAGHIVITSVDVRYDVTAIPSGLTTSRLHLYSATPPSAIADNSAWDLSSGDRSVYIGYVDLTVFVDLGSTLFTQADSIIKQIKLGAAETSLYGYLVTTGAFSPAGNSEVLQATIKAVSL